MNDRQRTIDDLELLNRLCHGTVLDDAIALLKEHELLPLRCKKCSFYRDDGWCKELSREVRESDYCSFGAWEAGER